MKPLYINECGIVTPLGGDKEENARALYKGSREGIVANKDLVPDKEVWIGTVKKNLHPLPKDLADLDCRNNRLMQLALSQIAPAIHATKEKYGSDRIAVILGSSTSGIAEGEEAFAIHEKTGKWPAFYDYRQQEISSLSTFTARLFGLTGASYTIATACSSSAKVFASARRLIKAGLADAAIVGGADSLCRTTLNGFQSLALLSSQKCNPFSLNRSGITIGEGASAFLMTSEEGPVQLLGVGETSDAHHMTAPDPDGSGARNAMLQALNDAGLAPEDIAYINLHGTATRLNDAMEAIAVSSVFGKETPCSSTKSMTGHMLGATGGCEAAFLWLTLNPAFNKNGSIPPHIWDGIVDPALPSLHFVGVDQRLPQYKPLAMLSNSFGFGGSNAALIFGQTT